jgi:hypothetical protein
MQYSKQQIHLEENPKWMTLDLASAQRSMYEHHREHRRALTLQN